MKNYTITVNGNSYEVSVEEGNGAFAPVVNTAPKAAPVAKAAPAPVAKAAPSGAQGSVKINSPMPGKILAVKATVGQVVKRGTVLLVLEAMKMENEIVAPSDGSIASVTVSVGSTVEAGDVLVTLN